MSNTKDIVAPKVSSTWVDDTGRTLHVATVNLTDRLDRHVIGSINGIDYACSLATWQTIWMPRPVVSEEERGDETPFVPLFDEQGKAIKRTPGWGQ